jgi:hypothetical protein
MNAQRSETPAVATTGAQGKNLSISAPILAEGTAFVQPKGWRLVAACVSRDDGSERVLSLGAGELAALGRSGPQRYGEIREPGAAS